MAVSFIPRDDCNYKYDYNKIFHDIANGHLSAKETYRELILNDLFFITFFILCVPPANHPFVVDACRMVEEGPKTDILEVWAREHFKSTILTAAEPIQLICKNPNITIGIFSHTRPVAKSFLRVLKTLMESNELLKFAFPEIFWQKPESQSPKWSEDDGLVVQRDSFAKESTVEAWGLVDGQPTGKHFHHRIYDDIETMDVVSTPEMINKLKERFDISQNLGKEGGTMRVIGTYYSHAGVLAYIRDLKDVYTGKPLYYVRRIPATVDGTRDGKPVLMSQRELDKRKTNEYMFNCQQLLDPTPTGARRLSSSLLVPVKRHEVPPKCVKFLLVDQAGDAKEALGKVDSWGIGLVAVNPFKDDIGASDIYLTDLIIEPMAETEAIEAIVRMYLRGGVVQAVGVEKVGLSRTHVHIQAALEAKGRRISTDTNSLIFLRPSGREKKKRIESALAWPLMNGKIHYVEDIAKPYLDRLKMELDQFPYWYDDGLDMLSYLYDILADIPLFQVYDKPLPERDLGIE